MAKWSFATLCIKRMADEQNWLLGEPEDACATVIEIASLRNQRTEIEMEAAYFRGCYDSVGYLRKTGIL